MIPSPIRAHKLRVGLNCTHTSKHLSINFAFDNLFSGILHISLSTIPSSRELAFIGFSASSVLATLGQAEVVECDFAIDPSWYDEAQSLLTMLYDVRSATDKTRLVEPPQWTFSSSKHLTKTIATKSQDLQTAVCLFSGGNDSSLAIHSLIANRFKVHPLFVEKINHHAPGEEKAVNKLSELYGWDVAFSSCDTSDLLMPGNYFSPNYFNTYPHFNSVLFGRDWLLLSMTLPLVRETGAGSIAVGIEHDLLNTTYNYEGKNIYRYELQSRQGLLLINKLINKVAENDIHLFSPLAGLTKVKVLHTIGQLFPDILRHGSSCFWSEKGPCGDCIKCELNSIFQNALGLNLIPFNKNPLENSWLLSELNKDPENPAIHGRNELIWALNKIISQSVTLKERHVKIFNERHALKYADIASRLDRELFNTYSDNLLPPHYHSLPWGS
jgi:7-cyano-7-deazaguanine synthase in queuosine biosynthesis